MDAQITQAILDGHGITSERLGASTAARRLLLVYAHPDDESFGSAGTIARYAAAGVAVHYACATRGECGTVAPALLTGHADVAALRTAELSCAARALGMAAVHYLNYRDSGMAGSADNQHPAALLQAAEQRVVGQIVALLRVIRPQVVVTFAPYGGYGHPDHIAVHRGTIAACAAAGDPARYPQQTQAGLAPWLPKKLYYSTFGVSWLRLGVTLMRLMRKDPRRAGSNNDVDLLRALAEATPITTTIRCEAYMDRKERAWLCHRSQLGAMAGLLRLPRQLRLLLVAREYFTRVMPAWDGAQRREDDLFTGISADDDGH